jgi:multiple sugar transport system permease protein
MNASSARIPLSKSQKAARKSKTISFIILFIVCLLFLFPFIYLVGTSMKTPSELVNKPLSIFPSWGNFTFEHYWLFLNSDNHGRIDNLPIWMINSLVITSLQVIITLIVDTLAAYAFVFFKFKGKNVIVAILLISMTIPGVIGTTPLYSLYVSIGKATGLSDVVLFTLHSVNNGVEATEYIYLYPYLWMIFPGVSGVFNLLLIKNFFESIPKDIVESARSDGASDLTIFRRIVLPLARSTILLVVLFCFVGSWNDLLWPTLITSGHPLNYTINVALVNYTGGVSDWSAKGAQTAAAVFSMLPILILFLFLQNKMIDGLASTGVKR